MAEITIRGLLQGRLLEVLAGAGAVNRVQVQVNGRTLVSASVRRATLALGRHSKPDGLVLELGPELGPELEPPPRPAPTTVPSAGVPRQDRRRRKGG